MPESIHNINKRLIGTLRNALYDCDRNQLAGQLGEIVAPDCAVHLAFPFEDLDGPGGLLDVAYMPLLDAVPDLERRDFILMAGETRGQNWVGCAGHYLGVFERPWLDIPPTQHLFAMRYHEFFRFEDGQIVEMQALWDIPQVMMAANAWPLSPSLAVEWVAPGPATEDGIITSPYDEARAAASTNLVLDMLTALKRSPEGAAAMELDRYWHPKMMWYGPAGIGSHAADIRFPLLASDPVFESDAGSWLNHGQGHYVRRWRLRRLHSLAWHVHDPERRWLDGHRARGHQNDHAQPGFLAL